GRYLGTDSSDCFLCHPLHKGGGVFIGPRRGAGGLARASRRRRDYPVRASASPDNWRDARVQQNLPRIAVHHRRQHRHATTCPRTGRESASMSQELLIGDVQAADFRRELRSTLVRTTRKTALPIVTAAIFLLAWEIFVDASGIRAAVLPAPSSVFSA